MVKAADIVAGLDHVQPCEGAWIASCPIHNDDMASLTIDESESGDAIVKCLAGCTQADLLEALQRKDLFSHSRDGYPFFEPDGSIFLPPRRDLPNDFDAAFFEDENPDSGLDALSPESRFSFLTMEELMAATDEVTWVVDDMLTTGGLSILVSKPKLGKTTLVQGLALAVARGEPWLDRDVSQGKVLYFALEDQLVVVRHHFRAMGMGDKPMEPIELFIESPLPKDAIEALEAAIKERQPKLVIIDPIFRLKQIKSESAYAEVTWFFKPLTDMARKYGVHIVCVHHAGKGEREDGDEALGSTAIYGAVDCQLILKPNGDSGRTLATKQRHGPDMPPTLLKFNAETQNISLGETAADIVAAQIKADICALLDESPTPLNTEEIYKAVQGGKKPKSGALNSLVRQGRIIKTGAGKKMSPYCYETSVSTFRTPDSPYKGGVRSPE